MTRKQALLVVNGSRKCYIYNYAERCCKWKSNLCVFPEGPEKAVWLTDGTFDGFNWAVKNINENCHPRAKHTSYYFQIHPKNHCLHNMSTRLAEGHTCLLIPKNHLSNHRPGAFHICPRKRTAWWVLLTMAHNLPHFLFWIDIHMLIYNVTDFNRIVCVTIGRYIQLQSICDLVLNSLQYPGEVWFPMAKVDRVQCSILY